MPYLDLLEIGVLHYEVRFIAFYRKLGVQILLDHTKMESTIRYLGIEVEGALEMAEQTEI